MTRDETEKCADAMREAISESARLARDEDGACRLCASPRGVKHAQACPLWPALKAKADYVSKREETGRGQPLALANEANQDHPADQQRGR